MKIFLKKLFELIGHTNVRQNCLEKYSKYLIEYIFDDTPPFEINMAKKHQKSYCIIKDIMYH